MTQSRRRSSTGGEGANKMIRPPLKWAGGKRWQLPHLIEYWLPNQDRRLVEPFCGGLAVAGGLVPTRALLNDVNPHLMNFYKWLRVGLTVPFSMLNDEASYYRARDRFNELITISQADTLESAALFYYLNRTGFNGLCRFNSSGLYNVPFGRHTKINYKSDFSDYKEPFSKWTFTNTDFQSIKLSKDDFVYADPPYDVEFTSYSSGGFDWDDQVRTAEWLAAHPGPVILSNQATARIIELYQELGYSLTFLDAPRRISRNGDRTPAKEVLASRNVVPEHSAEPAAEGRQGKWQISPVSHAARPPKDR